MTKIALGFEAPWADLCIPRDGDVAAAVALAGAGADVVVIAADNEWRRLFSEHGLDTSVPAFNDDHSMNPWHRERCRRGDLVSVPKSILHNNANCPGWPRAAALLKAKPLAFSEWGLLADADSLVYDTEARVWGLDNSEYATVVFRCPWCGVELQADGRVGVKSGDRAIQTRSLRRQRFKATIVEMLGGAFDPDGIYVGNPDYYSGALVDDVVENLMSVLDAEARAGLS